MSFEKLGEFEQINITGKELPQSHLEGIAPAQFENMNNIDRIKLGGEQVFTEKVETQAGIRGAFEEVAQEGTKEEFVKNYEQYVMNPQELQREKPEIYDFFCDRIFYGREYIQNGMEEFMEKTAPKEKALCEVYGPEERTLKQTAINDSAVTNCSRPFSYGNAEVISEKMDFVQGDIGMGATGTCGIDSSRNLMALCGKEFTEKETAIFAKDHYMGMWGTELPDAKRGGLSVDQVTALIKGMSGIETEYLTDKNCELNAELIADKLDHGYRGILLHDAGAIHGEQHTEKTVMGELADAIPLKPVSDYISNNFETRGINHAATFECAVRDGDTGKVAGFYICDSGWGEKKMYVEADAVEKAINVRSGGVVFTKQPYLNES